MRIGDTFTATIEVLWSENEPDYGHWNRVGEPDLRGLRFPLSDYQDMVQRKNRSKA